QKQRGKRFRLEELRKEAINRIKTSCGLTRREAEVTELILYGEQTDQICRILSIAESTLKKHILSIYDKTGSKNRAGLIRLFNETIRIEEADEEKRSSHGVS
ncbi:MAG: response regulator transcription factor, partial [Clostridia bacterium]